MRLAWTIARGVVLASVASLAQPSALAPTQEGRQLLHPMFQDHAVLQRDRPIAVYGETTPGAAVTVSLGTVSAAARAGSDGQWRATLPAMAAGGPYTLTATANGETRSASDVLVGDVFLCAGQSNMAFAQRQADGAAEDARTATDAQIRHLTVPPDASVTPRRTFARSVRWVVAGPETVGGFSAACYYFARELKKTANVPIGLVNASYGGARLRTFMSETALRKLGTENDALDLLDLYRTDPAAAMRRWGAQWESAWEKGRPHDGRPWLPAYDEASWKTAPAALGAWALWNGTNPDGFIGQVWMRTTVTLTADQASNADASLDLGAVNQEDETWLNGNVSRRLVVCQPHAIPDRAGVLKPGVNVIATNIYCGWRDCGMRGAAEARAIRFADGTSVPIAGPWRYQEVSDGWIGPQLPWGSVHGITLDHNGMILPIGPYTFRAAVWYQGESDVNYANTYTPALLAMMGEWRRRFDRPRTAVPARAVARLRARSRAANRCALGRLARSAAASQPGRREDGHRGDAGHRRSGQPPPDEQARGRTSAGHRRASSDLRRARSRRRVPWSSAPLDADRTWSSRSETSRAR